MGEFARVYAVVLVVAAPCALAGMGPQEILGIGVLVLIGLAVYHHRNRSLFE